MNVSYAINNALSSVLSYDYANAAFGGNNAYDATNNVLGTLGDTVFSIATNGTAVKVYTFDNLQRTAKARYATHDIHGRKQLLELVGFEAETVTLSIRLDVFFGISPETEAAALRDKMYKGEVQTLIIGGVVIGDFVIEDVKETDKHISNQGKIVVSEIDISLKEYVTDANS